ncbi:MAG: helix-turn-helix domain-containing protein [Oscillospiraceae bacterium]|nr:helix-turn-helix domain-containing protein [Oscillospiraceae bacterium]
MAYERELHFLQRALQNCHVQLLKTAPFGEPDFAADLGLRKALGLGRLYGERMWSAMQQAQQGVLYRVRDQFSCRYIFFLLPQSGAPEAVLIGPYLDTELTHAQLLEEAERHGVPANMFRLIENHYASLPVFLNEAPLVAMASAFCELLWGPQYEVQEVEGGQNQPIASWENAAELEEAGLDLQQLETRYRYENEMLHAVATGQQHKLELMMAGFSDLAFERRLPDELRNLKNYCIIMNTLLRKAAESAGVHPLYLDRLSSDFARRIEAVSFVMDIRPLMEDMFSEYCRMVRAQSTGGYSMPVQKALLHIGTHLADDLSLKSIAAQLDISAPYLSALFHKETGQTLTDCVTTRRMQYAQRLLQTTRLQIQTVAQHCGIYDVGYFSKQFKRFCGMTPKQFRSSLALPNDAE